MEKMESSLKSVQAVLDEWLGVQKNWMYLEPIFSAPDIQRQLPAEAKMFADVDKGLKLFLKKVSENPNCMRVGLLPGQADIFSSWNATLETTQKQLEAYLDGSCWPNCHPRIAHLLGEGCRGGIGRTVGAR